MVHKHTIFWFVFSQGQICQALRPQVSGAINIEHFCFGVNIFIIQYSIVSGGSIIIMPPGS